MSLITVTIWNINSDDAEVVGEALPAALEAQDMTLISVNSKGDDMSVTVSSPSDPNVYSVIMVIQDAVADELGEDALDYISIG